MGRAPSPPDRHSSELEDGVPDLQSKTHDITMLAEDDGEVYNPPPHIAARLSRPALNRRRSSAASSRRNSLSSTHSHLSNRSYRSSCQSHHVAHQLRRASILETRRARLADRAAHAEQVRLRAALAKATPRVSNTEEKALAAQQAREKYLAKVAAQCAEEVNRAKKVAEEMKERKAAEEKRARIEIEERHAEAERRRQEYYKRNVRKARSTSNAILETRKPADDDGDDDILSISVLDEDDAARRIQRSWRKFRRRAIVKTFTALDLSIEKVRSMEFPEASTFLAEDKVINATQRMMILICLDKDADQERSYVRRFLSAYMILGHPTDIFTKNGQQEQDLITKAKEVLISYESILAELTDSLNCTVRPTSAETILQSYNTYVSAFEAWKIKDASVLIDTMIDQFVALDGIWQTVKDDTRGEVANDYREGIRDQQVILLSKIKKLAGAEKASSMIKRAIRESRRARPRQRPVAEVRPRLIEGGEGNQQSASATAVAEISADAETVSQQDFELGELSRIFSVVPHNRVLVHELLIDPAYRIEISPHSDVRNALNREVCNSMRRGILDGQSTIWTLAVAENIRKRMLKLLKPGNSMYRLLSEVLDLDHVRNQCEQGMFSYDKFFDFMADILPKLCAPVRDEQVKQFCEVLNNKENSNNTDAMIEKLFGLLHIIDVLSLDYTNFMVSQAAPTLIREAVGYENRAFAQDIASQDVTLQRLKRWWRNAAVNVVTESTSHTLSTRNRASFAHIYARGITDLAVGLGPVSADDVPETLTLDINRFDRIRTDMLRFTVVGGILLTAKSLLKRDVRSAWKPEARRLFDLLSSYPQGPIEGTSKDSQLVGRILGVVESAHGMPASSREHLQAIISRFLTEAFGSRTPHLTDPVLKLLWQRLRMHIFVRLAASTSTERVRVASTASEGLAAIGLSEFIGQVGTVATELEKVREIDMNAHASWVRDVAAEVEQLGDTALAALTAT